MDLNTHIFNLFMLLSHMLFVLESVSVVGNKIAPSAPATSKLRLATTGPFNIKHQL